jgi:hypothetical protein
MNTVELLRWQWEGYPRYHRSRVNLLVHIVLVPVFLAGDVALVLAVWETSWRLAGVGMVAMVTSIALQGVGHGREPVPPEPFRGPLDAVSRIVCEQWVTFPRFVASGGWFRAWSQAGVA